MTTAKDPRTDQATGVPLMNTASLSADSDNAQDAAVSLTPEQRRTAANALREALGQLSAGHPARRYIANALSNLQEAPTDPRQTAPAVDSLGTLYGLDDTLKGRSGGLQAAWHFTPEEWRSQALEVLGDLAASGRPFTVDALRAAGVQDPDKHQRWGALMAQARHCGLITVAGHGERIAPNGAGVVGRWWIGTSQATRRKARRSL